MKTKRHGFIEISATLNGDILEMKPKHTKTDTDKACQEICDAIIEDNQSILDEMTVEYLIYGTILDVKKWQKRIEAELSND